MIDYDGLLLPKQFEEAQKQLKEAKNKDEKLALANYIGNLYVAQVCMGNGDLELDKKKIFGGKKKYNNIIKRINIYDDQLIENFVLHKDFHHQYFGEIIPQVEEELESIFTYTFPDAEKLKEYEVIDITSDFMRSIGLENLFERLYNTGKIHSSLIGQGEDNLGFTLYNPTNKDVDLFVRQFDGNFMSLLTLVHELGHAYDLTAFTDNIKDYNEYFYISFYGEVISRMFERLLYRYLIKNGIKENLAKDRLIDTEDLNHDYLLQAFVLSSLDDGFLRKGDYLDCSEDQLIKKIKKYFIDEDILREFVERVGDFDLSEDYNYAYGDIISMFLAEEVEQSGLANEIIFSFMAKRKDKFNPELLRDFGYGPDNYVKLYKKEIELIKK